MSGTGSDGAHGVRVIKAEGGITIVQDPKTARYAGMPQSAIETGYVDLVLPASRIGEELLSVLKYPNVLPTVVSPPKGPAGINKILEMIEEQVGCDFSNYKMNTINRRMGRRIAVNKFTSLEDYVQYLEKTPEELDLLVKDFLISVTSFFRDPEAFKALGKILPKLFIAKRGGIPYGYGCRAAQRERKPIPSPFCSINTWVNGSKNSLFRYLVRTSNRRQSSAPAGGFIRRQRWSMWKKNT